MKRRKPFAVFRRSVLPHLRTMSPQAWKTYSVLLLKARTAELRMTLDELAAESGMSRTATHRALRELIPYYVTKRGNGSLVIERYELDWTDEPENQISAGGKFAEHEISAGGKFAENQISAGGTEISAGGKPTPYIGVREEKDSLPNGSREGVQGKRESPDSGEPQKPPSPWAPWADAEALRDAILERYPAGGVDKAGARVLWQALIGLDQHRDEPRAPGIGKRMFAAASLIAERCPAERFAYLPSARKFFDGRWEDDWAEILKRWQAEVERAKKPRGDAEPEYRIERRRTGLR